MTLRSRDFESGLGALVNVGRNRKQTETIGGTGKPVSPILYLFGGGRQGLLHILLHRQRNRSIDPPHPPASGTLESPSVLFLPLAYMGPSLKKSRENFSGERDEP
jgi:hypothetical protein